MAGQLTISTLNDSSGVLATQNGMRGIAKAWAQFSGGTSPVILASFNVSSITKVSTGQYYVNYTTAMPSANYSCVGTSGYSDTYGGDAGHNGLNTRGTYTTYCWMINWNDADALVDCGVANVACFI